MKKRKDEIELPKISNCPHCGAEVKKNKTYCPNCFFTLPGCEEYEAQHAEALVKKSKKGILTYVFKRNKQNYVEDDKDSLEELLNFEAEENVPNSGTNNIVPNSGTEIKEILATEESLEDESVGTYIKHDYSKEEVLELAKQVGLNITEESEYDSERFREKYEQVKSELRDFNDSRSVFKTTKADAERNRAIRDREIEALIRDTRTAILDQRATERASEEERIHCVAEQIAVQSAERQRISDELKQSTEQISSLQDELSEMKKIALYDELTKLKNRHAFELDALEFDLKNLTLISIDVNNLKPTNDNYGHAYGDQLLTSVSESLEEIYGDNCYRTGGDEFVVALNGIRSRALEKRKTDFLSLLKKKEQLFDIEIEISVAYGVGLGDGIKTVKEILDEADANMYRDKETIKSSMKNETNTESLENIEVVPCPENRDTVIAQDRNVPNFGTNKIKEDVPNFGTETKMPQGADFDITKISLKESQPPINESYENIELRSQLRRFYLFIANNLVKTAILIVIIAVL